MNNSLSDLPLPLRSRLIQYAADANSGNGIPPSQAYEEIIDYMKDSALHFDCDRAVIAYWFQPLEMNYDR